MMWVSVTNIEYLDESHLMCFLFLPEAGRVSKLPVFRKGYSTFTKSSLNSLC